MAIVFLMEIALFLIEMGSSVARSLNYFKFLHAFFDPGISSLALACKFSNPAETLAMHIITKLLVLVSSSHLAS
jgi:hypothetical protein